jgi:ubiquinone/menaquinone biosynthesis C-methylase UbiE
MEGYSEFDPATYLEHNAVTPLRERIVRDMLGEFRGLRVLDAGCGDGSVSRRFLAHNHVTFLDVSAGMLAEAAKAIPPEYVPHAELVHAGLLEATFHTQFDIIVCFGVLAYIEDTERAIAHLAELLAPGGRCLLQITDTDNVFGKLIYNYARRRGQFVEAGRSRVTPTRMTRSQIVACASQHGLTFVGEKRHLPTVPGMWRFGRRLSSKYLEWGLHRQLGCETYIELARPER